MSEEFSVGVRILLQRMDTNPEEFIETTTKGNVARWSNLMGGVVNRKSENNVRSEANFFTQAELDALFDKYVVLRRKAFDDYVMREMLGADKKLSSLLTIQDITNQSLKVLEDQLTFSRQTVV